MKQVSVTGAVSVFVERLTREKKIMFDLVPCCKLGAMLNARGLNTAGT